MTEPKPEYDVNFIQVGPIKIRTNCQNCGGPIMANEANCSICGQYPEPAWAEMVTGVDFAAVALDAIHVDRPKSAEERIADALERLVNWLTEND